MNLQTSFQKRFFPLDEHDISRLRENIREHDKAVQNVAEDREKRCFGLMLNDDSTCLNFYIFFVTKRKSRLEGALLQLESNLKTRNELTFLFALALEQRFGMLKDFEYFNTFQHYISDLFFAQNIFVYGDEELKMMKRKDCEVMFPPWAKSAEYVPMISARDAKARL